MFWRILAVMMWRHWLSRKRRYICTVIELLLPLLLFVPCFLLRIELFGSAKLSSALKDGSRLEFFFRSSQMPSSILYTPETNFTRRLMALVGEKLGLQLLDELPGHNNYVLRGYQPFTDAFALFEHMQNMDPDEAVVIFHNVSEDGHPGSLNYSIRMKTPFRRQEHFILTEFGELDLESEYGPLYEPFVRLQWAIDSSFIQLLTGKQVKQKLMLQGFPEGRTKKESDFFYLVKTVLIFLAADFAVMPIFYIFMTRLLVEKASGVQELMKMMGVTTSALVTSHILTALLPGLIYSVGATIFMKLGPQALLEKSNAFLLFLGFFLHFLFIISLGMVFSYLGSRAPNSTLTVFTVYILVTLPAFLLIGRDFSKTVLYLCGLLPVMPLVWIIKEASKLEDLGDGLTFETMMKAHTPSTAPVIVAYLYFIIHIALCCILSWYFEYIIAGLYGFALPWNFLCTKKYWRKRAIEPSVDRSAIQIQEPQYFEKSTGDREAGIRVINVTKIYGLTRALDNVSLDVYKGEITVLLGHNGAGKSTLMSIISGMTGATKGRVLVNGLDIWSQKQEARRHLGFCPQKNMFLENVSVIEHLMFFTLIKRGTYSEARKSAEELLEGLNIQDKANSNTSDLSGGMKRRVQLGCALAGQANVLLLDEPTSGLDLETRRSLWDLLLTLRGSRTVLLSTHFMEEADALGDRVAALNDGRLRCHATPLYLKRAIDTGYRLSLTTIGKPNKTAITSTIKTIIPEATIKEVGPNSISYNLPLANTKDFPILFSKLESMKTELGINTMGVGASTLEEVFLKLCSSSDFTPLEVEETNVAPTYKRVTGARLYGRQLKALIKRYLRYLWVHKYSQILFGIVIIMIAIILITAFTNNSIKKAKTNQPPPETAMYRASPDARVLFRVNRNDMDLKLLNNQYTRLNLNGVSNDGEAMLRTGQQRNIKDNNYMAEIKINETVAKVSYEPTVPHAAPVALNLLSNVIAAALLRSNGTTITAYNHPLDGANKPSDKLSFGEPKNLMNIFMWKLLIVLMILLGLTCLVHLPCKERVSGARLNHILAGCSPELHWGTMLLTATVQVLCTYVLVLMISCAALDFDKTFADLPFIIATALVVSFASMAIIAISYEITFFFSEAIVMGAVISLNIVFVIIFPAFMKKWPTPVLMTMAEVVVPQYTFTQAMGSCVDTAYFNALCKLNKERCPLTDLMSEHFQGGKCCGSSGNALCYFCFGEIAPGLKLLYFIGQIIFYMTMVFLRQRGTFCMIWEKIRHYSYKPPSTKNHDKNVKTEQFHVERTIVRPVAQIKDIMLVSDVHKKYSGCCCKGINAVNGVCFSVKKGECFGLLGVNGAGKSTMFQMITADKCATRGQFFANGHHLKIPCSDKYLHSLAYCPQFWGIDDFLTGRQNLNLLLAMHGLNEQDMNQETLAWIKLVDLEKYTDHLVSEYSGGCLRRLSAASALCTGAPVTLLDEPTAGVDVAARRSVWFGLKRALREQRAIVITSHSLDEMEALCQRIAIMAGGEIRALGSPAGLRAAYAVGHSVIFKIKYVTEAASRLHVEQLKRMIEDKFNCSLKDEHKTMLHYHINETMPYSKLFEDMEQLQTSFSDLIEDYSVSETTLEEVFLSFAKAQEEESKATNKNAGTKRKISRSRPIVLGN